LIEFYGLNLEEEKNFWKSMNELFYYDKLDSSIVVNKIKKGKNSLNHLIETMKEAEHDYKRTIHKKLETKNNDECYVIIKYKNRYVEKED
jgi:pantothenate kinase